MRKTALSALSCMLFITSTAVAVAKDEISVDTYTIESLEPLPEISKPLESIIDLRLPDRISMVGVAVEFYLKRSGYRVKVDTLRSRPEMAVLFSLPIPDQHRSLGRIRLKTALRVLSGEAFYLEINPISREIWYSLRNDFDRYMIGIPVSDYIEKWNSRPDAGEVFSQSSYVSMISQEEQVYGPILIGETLGDIALSLKDDNTTLEQVMVSVFKKNKNAFIDGNMNLLSIGSTLVIPSSEEILAVETDLAKKTTMSHYKKYLSDNTL